MKLFKDDLGEIDPKGRELLRAAAHAFILEANKRQKDLPWKDLEEKAIQIAGWTIRQEILEAQTRKEHEPETAS